MAHSKTAILGLWAMAAVLAACGGTDVSEQVGTVATGEPVSQKAQPEREAETGGEVWEFGRFRNLEAIETAPPLAGVEIGERDNLQFLMVEVGTGASSIATIVSRVKLSYEQWHGYVFRVQVPTELPAGQSVRFRVYDIAVLEKSYGAGQASSPDPDFIKVRFESTNLGQPTVAYETPAGLAVDDSWFPTGWRPGGAQEADRGAFAVIWPSDKAEVPGNLQAPDAFFEFQVPEGLPDTFVVSVEVVAPGLAQADSLLIDFEYRKRDQ